MPKLSRSNFIYAFTFFTLLLVGVATIYFVSQNGGLDFGEETPTEDAVAASNVVDDPQASLTASCTHEGVPFFTIRKADEQKDFPAKVIYANNETFSNPSEQPIIEGTQSIDVPVPAARESSQQMYFKVVYTVEGKDVTADVQTIRLDPCFKGGAIPQ